MKSSLAVVLAAVNAVTATIEVLSSTGSGAFVFTLGYGTYYSPSAPVASDCSKSESSILIPLTVLKSNATTITSQVLSDLSAEYASIDDVWTEEFLGGAIALSAPEGATIDASVSSWLSGMGAKYLRTGDGVDASSLGAAGISMLSLNTTESLPPGPYTLSLGPSGTTVRQAYKVQRDKYEAFLFGVTPNPGSSSYTPVDFMIPSYQDAWIPVPSKLYWLGDERPLAGMRIALKDIYSLEGIKKGGGSRSYAEVYPPQEETAVSIQKLLGMGAVVIGITKTSQFAHGADPWQFIDIHYPWNPRGDGYLTAASSSSGSAAAIGAYDWLDITIGSDTRGSVRKPAALVGSYGIRPTWESMDLTGVIPLATEMDTAGFFARDPVIFYKVAKLWYEGSPVPVDASYSALPKKIIYPVDYYPLVNPAAQEIFESFMSSLESAFGMERSPINFTAALNAGVSNPGITNITAFQLTSNRLAEYVSYHEVGMPLAEAWEAKFPGAGYPPLDPNPRNAFARSVNLTQADYDAAVATKNEFKAFFLDQIIRPDPETCSDGIMILDMGTGGLPSYREQALNSRPGATSLSVTVPGGGPTMPSNYLASTAGCPQVGIPFGQVAYQSYVSLQEEMLPVNVDLVAAPGCDGMLLDLVQRLAEMGVAKTVKVGKTAF